MHSIRSFRDLLVWQQAMSLAELTYEVARRLPGYERFGLASQMQRSAVSVASNIAEGHARSGTAEFQRFVSIAFGSLAELETQLELAVRLKYVEVARVDLVLTRAAELGRMLRGLQRKLAVRRRTPSL